MKYFTIVLFIYFFVSSCDSKISGEFVSHYAETTWIYKFNMNGTYTFRTHGHMGESENGGEYYLTNNTITLYREIEDPCFENGGLRLYWLNDNCLITTYGQEYCSTVTENEIIGICDDYLFTDSIRSYILNSNEYADRFNMLKKLDSTLSLSIEMGRVIRVDDKILDVYQVQHYYKRQNQMINPRNLRFYVDRCNKEMYTGEIHNLKKIKL